MFKFSKYKNLIKKHFKKVLLFSALIVAVVLVLPEQARALDLVSISANVILFPVKMVAYLINFIIGLLAMLGAFFVEFMLNLNSQVAGPSNALVHVGWTIMRDITNLGFVLVIIVIALATILRFQTYGAQALLPKLIAAAILVNFSLTIGSVIINFSQIATNFFYQKVDSGASGLTAGGKITSIISSAFGPQRLAMEDENPIPPDPEEEAGGLAKFGAAFLTGLGGIFFSIIFTLLMAFILLVYAGMLFVRYLYLSFLLLISPIVWLFWVVPSFQSYWHKWWDKFFSWTFFAPASAFFLYLALTAAEALGKEKLIASQGFAGPFKTFMDQGAQMAVLGGLLMGGLIVAQQMGIAGAAGAVGLAKAVGKGAVGYVGKGAWSGVKGGFGAKNAIKTFKETKSAGGSGWKSFRTAAGFGGKDWKEITKSGAKTVGNVTTFGLGKSAGRGAKEIATGEFKDNSTSIFSAVAQTAGKHLGLIVKKEKPTKDELRDQTKIIDKKIEKEKDPTKKRKLTLEKNKIEYKIREENKLDVEAEILLRSDINNPDNKGLIKEPETEENRAKNKKIAIKDYQEYINNELNKESAKGDKGDKGKIADYRQYLDITYEQSRKVIKNLNEINKRSSDGDDNNESPE